MRLRDAFLSLLFIAPQADAQLDVDWSSTDAVKKAMKPVAKGMVDWYHGYRVGDVPGNLPDPYKWWQAGAMFGALIDYYHLTQDEQFNDWTMQGMLHQVGDDQDYMPANQSKSLGNDDQGFWGMAAMSAAENKFPDPPDGQPSWVALAQAVFATQAGRIDKSTCGGGLRWQIFTFNQGYDYKNTISQGCFFNIASRLAKYTGNQTYAEYAEKSWDWLQTIGMVNSQYHFYDGSDTLINCTRMDRTQWTYNAGIYLYGTAVMWNMSAQNGDENNKWKERVNGIIKALPVFFPDNVMVEVACEPNNNCNTDQRSFKAYLARWMASTIQVASWTEDQLTPFLEGSRKAAAKACNDAGDTAQCGLKWTTGQFDGSTGMGENMAVLEVMGTALVHTVAGPVQHNTGGTSKGDPNAGSTSPNTPTESVDPINNGDRAGAAILTVVLTVWTLGGAYWMMVSEA